VIYMISHDAAGAQGFVVNRPLGEILLARLLAQMRMDGSSASGTVRLHGGGPVESLRIFALHTSDYTSAHSTVVKDGVSVTSDPDILLAVAAGKGPRRLRLVLGYAGWAPGQLEAEMEAGAWIRAAADESLLFDEDYDKKWDKAQARQKIDL
jgi:putative transcriptional regulator